MIWTDEAVSIPYASQVRAVVGMFVVINTAVLPALPMGAAYRSSPIVIRSSCEFCMTEFNVLTSTFAQHCCDQ